MTKEIAFDPDDIEVNAEDLKLLNWGASRTDRRFSLTIDFDLGSLENAFERATRCTCLKLTRKRWLLRDDRSRLLPVLGPA